MNLKTTDNALESGLAIVANGDTHAAIASGQYVYVKNHSSLAEGLYKATAAIATNGALSTSNLTADGSGGLNDLVSDVDLVKKQIHGFFDGKINSDTFDFKIPDRSMYLGAIMNYNLPSYTASASTIFALFIDTDDVGYKVISQGDYTISSMSYSNGTITIKLSAPTTFMVYLAHILRKI